MKFEVVGSQPSRLSPQVGSVLLGGDKVVLLVRPSCAACAANVLAGPLSAADPSAETACDRFQGHDTQTMTRELITTIDIPMYVVPHLKARTFTGLFDV